MASSNSLTSTFLPFFLAASLLIICSAPFTLVLGSTSSAPSPVAGTKSTSKSALTIAQFLEGHNAARRDVGVPPLRWDKSLAKYAHVYANQRRHDCELVHSPGYAFGENIFWGMGRRWRVDDIMAAWVGEKRWYHYGSNSCSGDDCSHYTQVVWRTTERVGCARIVCDTGDTFVACEYHPPGNYVGARPY